MYCLIFSTKFFFQNLIIIRIICKISYSLYDEINDTTNKNSLNCMMIT